MKHAGGPSTGDQQRSDEADDLTGSHLSVSDDVAEPVSTAREFGQRGNRPWRIRTESVGLQAAAITDDGALRVDVPSGCRLTTLLCVELDTDPAVSPVTNPVLRAVLVVAGLALTAVGVAGFVIPGLPGTPLLLVAAWMFSMSNDRLYRWTVTNRWFGRMVADYRAGLGIPRRVKLIAVTTVIVVVSISVGWAIDTTWLRVGIAALGGYGILFILTRPTRESVLVDT